MNIRLGEKIRRFVDNLDNHRTTPQITKAEHVDSFEVVVIDKGETVKRYTVTIINHDKDDKD